MYTSFVHLCLIRYACFYVGSGQRHHRSTNPLHLEAQAFEVSDDEVDEEDQDSEEVVSFCIFRVSLVVSLV